MRNKSVLYLLLVLLVSITGFFSCSEDRLEEDPTNYSSMDEFYDKYKEEEQLFVIDSTPGGPIVGKHGTVIYVSKDLFAYPNGGPIADYPITIGLVEVYNTPELVLWNTPTTSSGLPFESVGNVRVKAYKNGVELVLQKNKTYVLEYPSSIQPQPNESMSIYYGYETSTTTEWTNQLSKVSSYLNNYISQLITTNNKYQMYIPRMGWIGIGRDYTLNAPITLSFKTNGQGTDLIDIFVIPKLSTYMCAKQIFNLNSGKIFAGEPVTILAMAKNQDNKYVIFLQESTFQKDTEIELTMIETTEENLLTIIKGL